MPENSRKKLFNNMPTIPEYTFQFPFERSFEIELAENWMNKHFTDSFLWTSSYFVIIFVIRYFMKNRKPYDLRRPLFLWSLSLAIFSILGTIRFVPEIYYVVKNFGFHYSVCSNSFIYDSKITGFWTFMFTISKVPELGDTLFIVLRKQNLMFLHWYHHITVLHMAWYSFYTKYSVGRWYVGMNYAVHSIMYSYYALRALGIRLPKLLSATITFTQICQMIAGAYVTFYGFLHSNENNCQAEKHTTILGLIMYGSYFILFVNFFLKTYFGKKSNLSKINNNKLEKNLDVNGNVLNSIKKID